MFGFTLQSSDKRPKSAFWENDVIELTDSDSSDLPDTLSPLVKGPQNQKKVGSRKQSPSKGFVSLYVDTSDEGESDNDCVLVLCVFCGTLFQLAHFLFRNDPPGSRKPIRRIAPAKGMLRHFRPRREILVYWYISRCRPKESVSRFPEEECCSCVPPGCAKLA